MPATYTNKFTVQVSDVVRINFQDERLKIENLPASLSLAAEVVMTRENALLLAELLKRLMADGK